MSSRDKKEHPDVAPPEAVEAAAADETAIAPAAEATTAVVSGDAADVTATTQAVSDEGSNISDSAASEGEPAKSKVKASKGAKAPKEPKTTKAKTSKKKQAVDPLDPEYMQAHADKALDLEAPVFLCPVRHHSFCLSLHLPRLIEAYQPDLIAVEMPSVFKDEVPDLADPKVIPPVAFFSFALTKKSAAKTSKAAKSAAGTAVDGAGGTEVGAEDDEEQGEKYRRYLYPLLAFSPEYVALTEALKRGIDYDLIDLTSFDEDSFTSFSDDSTFYDDDQVIARSSVYQELCERSGAHTFAEFWDKHFEINALTQDTMSYLHQLYNYCYLIRQGIDEEQEPFTVQRELFMLKSLQAAMKTHKRILVVTGGLHSVALCDYLYFKKKKATAMRYPKVPSETYLIPYSFAAADSQTGYGAGVVFPYYFQQFYTVLKGLVPFMPAPERELPALEVVGGDESPEAVAHVSSDTENEPSNAVTADTTAIAETVIAETAVAETAVADVAEAVGLDEEQAVIWQAYDLLQPVHREAAAEMAAEQDSGQKKKKKKKDKAGNVVYYDALHREINVQALTGSTGDANQGQSLLLQCAHQEQEAFGAKKGKATKAATAKTTEAGTADATTAEAVVAESSAEATEVAVAEAAAIVEAVAPEQSALSLEQRLALLATPVDAQAIAKVNFALNLFFVERLRDYRNQGFSTADKIGCELMLRGLAALRQKLVPSVFELIDAVKSSLIKEELNQSHYLLDQLMRLLTSVHMGQVPLSVRMPPIWRDFLQQAKTYGISLKDQQAHQIRIDINKNAKSLEKSRFINRVSFLSPDFCPPSLNRDGNHTFNYINRTETYVYHYVDEVVMQIMAASEYGESLLQACRTIVRERCKAKNLSVAEICSLYRQCVNMGIEDQYYKVKELLAQAIVHERQLTAIGDALGELNSYDFVAKSTEQNLVILQHLMDDLIKRGCEILLQQNDVVEDELDAFVAALEELNYYAIKQKQSKQLYFATLEELLDSDELSATLQGAYLALLYKNRRLRYEVLVSYVNQFVLGSISSNNKSVGFFYTLILISRGNLFNRDSILSLLNVYLQSLSGEEFLKVLVLLRRVFVHFNAIEMRKLVRMLKRLLGLSVVDFNYQVEPEEFLRNRQIDQELEQDMVKWHLLAQSSSVVESVAQAGDQEELNDSVFSSES